MSVKEISQKLKQVLNKAGLKHLRVKKGTGTAYNWISIWCKKGDYVFSEQDIEKLREALGINIGRTNCYSDESEKIESMINKQQHKDIVESEEYKKLKIEFYETALKFQDSGSCCGGAGVFILKDEKKIDFWNNSVGQSDHRIWMAEEQLKDKFTELGLITQHESGWMD